ncbi:hypothetical protein [Mariprofundus aestuarium]|uniref:hypothetical protein n=1 Tax=Mariprofundus aestuarium TaxID=1921086 RepID=UPI0012FDB306|nr:hypothetical protein [Mariprofundus aestuarium]
MPSGKNHLNGFSLFVLIDCNALSALQSLFMGLAGAFPVGTVDDGCFLSRVTFMTCALDTFERFFIQTQFSCECT